VALASQWLNKVTNKAYALKYVPISNQAVGVYSKIGALILEDRATKTETTFQDVGLGLSQVLPILASLAQFQIASKRKPKRLPFGPSSSVLFLEQPELHLHPKMQADLMEIVVKESLAMNSQGPQVIMETHSENMILKVQKLIRTGQLRNTSVSILYVDRSTKGKSSSVIRLNLDESGDFIDRWPLGFADVRLEDIF
jgi:predicted ATPase